MDNALPSRAWPRFTLRFALVVFAVIAGVLAMFFPPSIAVVVVDMKVGSRVDGGDFCDAARPLLELKFASDDFDDSKAWLGQRLTVTRVEDNLVVIGVRGMPFESSRHLRLATQLANELITNCDPRKNLESYSSVLRNAETLVEIEIKKKGLFVDAEEANRYDILIAEIASKLDKVEERMERAAPPVIVSKSIHRTPFFGR